MLLTKNARQAFTDAPLLQPLRDFMAASLTLEHGRTLLHLGLKSHASPKIGPQALLHFDHWKVKMRSGGPGWQEDSQKTIS